MLRRRGIMKKSHVKLACAGLSMIAAVALMLFAGRSEAAAGHSGYLSPVAEQQRPIPVENRFEVQLLVNGYPLEEYYSRGKLYVEAVPASEYEVRIRNPLPYRVAVALSVDGLNSIDARRTSAWNDSKWVIKPFDTIQISGWQMSSERARRFYFTSERDSYGAKLGQTANLGNISAVFFRERRSYPIPVTPGPPPRPYPIYKDNGRDNQRSESPAAGSGESAENKSKSGGATSSDTLRQRQPPSAEPLPDDEYAATGIGRSVHNDVRWVNLDLDSRPTAEVTIRYEYYPALVRLGVLPRRYERPDPLRRREGARGFDNRRFSPEP